VVDLDTVMPGLAVHDFGDLVRSAVTGRPEDEPDLDAIEVREEVFGDLVGRPSQNGNWQPAVVLQQGRVDYHAVDPPVANNGTLRVLASPLPRRGRR